MKGVAVKPLTVGFHEAPFLSKLNQENQLGFWFQLSNKQRQQAGSPWGPSNPQALNRYSYVLNNPLKYTDPTGHTTYRVNGDDIDHWLSIFNRNINRLKRVPEVAAILGGFAAGIACAPGLVIGLACGGATAGAFYAIAQIIQEQGDAVNILLNWAKRKAGEGGTVVVDVVDGRVTATAYDSNGNLVDQDYVDVPAGSVTQELEDAASEADIPPEKR
jgi:hypothetical protein